VQVPKAFLKMEQNDIFLTTVYSCYIEKGVPQGEACFKVWPLLKIMDLHNFFSCFKIAFLAKLKALWPHAIALHNLYYKAFD